MPPPPHTERGLCFVIGWAMILTGVAAGYWAMWLGLEWAWAEFVAEW